MNCIAPGFFATEMSTPLLENPEFNDWVCKRTSAGRWGTLQEIGPAAVFLASDEASPIHRVRLSCDVRWQPGALPLNERYFGTNLGGTTGIGYGELVGAKPLTREWHVR